MDYLVNKHLILEKLNLNTEKNTKKFINRSTRVINNRGKINKYSLKIGTNILPTALKIGIPLIVGTEIKNIADDINPNNNDEYNDIKDNINDNISEKLNIPKNDYANEALGVVGGLGTGYALSNVFDKPPSTRNIEKRLKRDGVDIQKNREYIKKQNKINNFINDHDLK